MPQETNMAELLRLMQNMIVRFDDLNGKVDDLATDMKDVKTGLVRVEGKVDLLSGQFQDVAGQAMKDTQRITSLEGRHRYPRKQS